MKRLKLVVVSVLVFVVGTRAMSQSSDQFSLSNEKPRQGERLTFTFTPRNTEPTYTAALYVFHQSGFNAVDLSVNVSGNTYTGNITLPDSATAFLVSFQHGETSKKVGFSFPVFADGQPVVGANHALGQIYNGYGESFASIDRDIEKSLDFYRAELSAYPESINSLFYFYIGLLTANERLEEAKTFVDSTAKVFFSSENSKEEELVDVTKVYENFLKDKPKADSLRTIVLQRYPNGLQAAGQDFAALRAETDYVKKTQLYVAYVNRYGTSFPARVQSSYAIMAEAAIKEADYPKFDEYLNSITDKNVQASLLNQVAWPLVEAGERLDYAAAKSKQSLDLLSDFIANPAASRPAMMTESQWRANAEYNFRNNADTYALIRYKQGNLAEAVEYQRKAVGDYGSAEVNERFVQFLKEAGAADEAQAAAEKAISKGESSANLTGYLREIYIGKGNSEQQWSAYLSGLEARYVAEVRKKLLTELIDEEAPKFSLVNMNGETVSSESLKGKVYVVDFWATWCGPCKASFPAMQQAVNKFKERDDIEFVFVNTWENISDREEIVKKFIADNKYSFNVLFDTVEGSGNDFDVVGAYKVKGIPTKFIVDKNGRIRFKVIGFSGSSETEAQKVSLMIDLAANPPADSVAALWTNKKI